MVVARLDKDQLLRQRDREQAALAQAQSQLVQAGTTVEWTRQSQASDLDQRRADLSQAQARLRELEAGSRPQEIKESSAAVEAAQTAATAAQKDWERAQVLYKRDDISASQFDQYRKNAESAAAALRQAQERLAMVREGPRKEEIEAAQAQVARAAASIKWAEAQRLDVTRKQEDVVSRRADIERERAQVGLIDSQLGDTVAASPIDGVVLVKSANVGEILAPGTTVMTIGDIDHPWLRGYINERDLGRVKPGTKAKISTDSYPGKVYWGRVSFIASEAEFTPKQIQTSEERLKLVYRIKIDVDNPQHELKSNMPADAELVLE
jgi:HlyD family secretion protein